MSHAWMPLAIDDYLADTRHLTTLEHGAYLLLIMRYWQKGGLPDDERLIARLAGLSEAQWAESRDVLASFFDEGWRHNRIEAELHKAEEIISKRKSAASRMHANRNSKSDAHAEQVHSTCSDMRVPPSPLPEPEVLNSHPSDAHSPTIGARGPSRTQGRSLPDDWSPNDKHRAEAEALGRDGAWLDRQAESMRLWAVSNRNRAVARKADWDATFLGWIRRENEKNPVGQPRASPGWAPPDTKGAVERAMAKLGIQT